VPSSVGCNGIGGTGGLRQGELLQLKEYLSCQQSDILRWITEKGKLFKIRGLKGKDVQRRNLPRRNL